MGVGRGGGGGHVSVRLGRGGGGGEGGESGESGLHWSPFKHFVSAAQGQGRGRGGVLKTRQRKGTGPPKHWRPSLNCMMG